MFYVYIIKNSINGRYYIGSTNNIQRRLSEHNRGKTFSTKHGKNTWKLVYFESKNTHMEVITREKLIKSYKGGEAFKKLLRD